MAGVKPQPPIGEPAPVRSVEHHAGRGAGPDPSVGATAAIEPPAPRALPIVWQRLVKDGETCERCGSTHQELLAALTQLEPALRPLGLQPVLQTLVLDEPSFKVDPSASNRLWIGGRSVEDWLGARAGSSPCCSVCGDLPCRTLEVDGHAFDAVPRHLIVKAALIAAAATIAPSRPGTGPAPCCAGESAGSDGGRCAQSCD